MVCEVECVGWSGWDGECMRWRVAGGGCGVQGVLGGGCVHLPVASKKNLVQNSQQYPSSYGALPSLSHTAAWCTAEG